MTKSRLRNALEILKGPAWGFPPVQGIWDYNTEDVFHIAKALDITLPSEKLLPEAKLDERKGVEIAEIVDNTFIKATTIRSLFPKNFDEFCQRAEETAKKVMKILPGVGSVEAFAAALYLWHGCINIAKLTREVDAVGTKYTPEMRTEMYNNLERDWGGKDIGSGWVKLGVTVAKRFETERAKKDPSKKIIDDWVPPDSPYWDNWRSRSRTQ